MIAASCSTLQIHSDHDPNANFSRYRTYGWATEPGAAIAPDISGVPSELIDQRIRGAVDSQLAAKGLRRASGGESPDLLVTYHLKQRQKAEAAGGAGLGFGYGFGPWFGSAGYPSYSYQQYTEGTLVLDLVDARSKRLAWRGIATDKTEGPEKSDEKISQAIAETLERYPPGPPPSG